MLIIRTIHRLAEVPDDEEELKGVSAMEKYTRKKHKPKKKGRSAPPILSLASCALRSSGVAVSSNSVTGFFAAFATASMSAV